MRLLGLVAVMAVITSCSGGGGDAAGEYLEEYGGSRDVYERILASSDCGGLQEEFDTAAANNDAAEPGTPQFRQTLGYMTAADERMQELGCY